MKLLIKKLSDDAVIPTRADAGAAGYDLYASIADHAYDQCIKPGQTVMVHTGVAVAIPEGYFGGVYARSGLATKQGLRPANCVGIIDSSYRGEIIVALHNDSKDLRVINRGERIAQLVIQPCVTPEIVETDELDETERGSGGFGSTGI